MKPAPTVTIPQPVRIPIAGRSMPLGVILCPEGYQHLGKTVETLGIAVAVDSKASQRCEWFSSWAAYNSAKASIR